ncbi:MAG: hypothetical protein ABIS23_06525, partial [Sphingomicrobium sp.]
MRPTSSTRPDRHADGVSLAPGAGPGAAGQIDQGLYSIGGIADASILKSPTARSSWAAEQLVTMGAPSSATSAKLGDG